MPNHSSHSITSEIANASQQHYQRIMLVCICNAITEQELRSVARQGVTCPESAYRALGKTPQCRICLDHAEDVMVEEQSSCRGRCSRSLNAPSQTGTWATA
ncbi:MULTISPECIES: (2Fe-2S)-binding protein [unclassified Sphingobium]|uniref:(2Fe-2S)-binding protein n=1 Tax=unclassified Sphingobium TaxID=2611147 RepID=UPI0029CAB022|nr:MULTISPECIES: (2Fe-2S)-binding protein [unclassified Sphingobium]MCW2349991.1 bacterioferritin-associated ferredoxin [Sphingobium sp. B12D2B]MCW2369092.1 bacterioferritin-associated ferredoxin [Sphingobium sp. B11D3D]